MTLTLINIEHHFTQGSEKIEVLRGINLEITAGEILALVGPSGAGKSTLLQIAGLLEKPAKGDVVVNGESTMSFHELQRTLLRRNMFGFVYQFHHLLPEFNAVENVMLPMLIAGKPKEEAKTRAQELLKSLGLEERLTHRPKQLSGGEQQRVAIARAIANKPKILLADEPTGNLDPATAEKVFEELSELARQEDVAALIATHNMELAERMDRSVYLENGVLG